MTRLPRVSTGGSSNAKDCSSSADSPEIRGCRTGEPEPPFPALRGQDRSKQQTGTESSDSQHGMEKGIAAAGHVAGWEN